ncbi:MAG TPA: sulfite exporter TauE/SafE family protein [Myxococcota bacterium]|nr:sulfite exporter TauE/SafE family protein [Myxococcota bacterium]
MNPLGLLLSAFVGLALGLLGGGGSILTLPILMYAYGTGEKEAIATSLLVVGVTSATAVVSHARRGNVEWRAGLVFAGAGSVGAFLGGMLAALVPGALLIDGFLLMMVATSIAMLRGRREVDAPTPGDLPVAKILAQGLAVGLVSGLVGAGGGFLVVPALALLGGLPMPRAVGTSLLVIAIQSTFGFLGHVTHVSIDLAVAAQVIASAVLGSFLGATLAPKVPAAALRKGFGAFVMGMAVYMGVHQLV